MNWKDACAESNAELKLVEELRRDAMKTVISGAHAVAALATEIALHRRFMEDVRLCLATGADTLCGTKWIQAKGIQEALKRFADATSEVRNGH